ncbi:hypothetical protein [Pseudomonas sp. GL-B-16]|uniref:hypothetical protein n=1 Tax=Pseudomonas sp. GL-B-16 TaxID=2832373 RepID=UPI001CBD64B9|nr:hypothetical protein [Pseudomonas sp. GL-B-16]
MSINPLNNPMTGLTGFFGNVINAGGQAVQGYDDAKGKVKNQKQDHDVIGDPDSVDAHRGANTQSEKFQAGLIGKAEAAKEQIQTQALYDGIESAHEDLTNKKTSSIFTNMKGIQF